MNKSELIKNITALLEQLEKEEDNIFCYFAEKEPNSDNWTDQMNETFDSIYNPLGEAGELLGVVLSRLEGMEE